MINLKFMKEVGIVPFFSRTLVRQFYKRILKSNQKMQLPTGGWLTLPHESHFGTEAYVTQANVDWGSESLLRLLTSGKAAFLDVGANIGYYSLYFAPHASAVYSFEPDPRSRCLLEENIRGYQKIEVVPCALGAAPAKARFVLSESAEFSHLREGGELDANEIEVDVITIDDFVADRGITVEAIKIDAEGHDLDVVEGALSTLRQQHPVILLETDPEPRLFSLMSAVEYRAFAFYRHATTRKRGFCELVPDQAPPGETKMIFLVPSALAETTLLQAAHC